MRSTSAWLLLLGLGTFMIAACNGGETVSTLIPTPTPTATPAAALTVPAASPTLLPTPISAPPSSGDSRPLGKVETIADHRCGGPFGDRCLDVIVTCPGISDAAVTLRVTGTGIGGTAVLTTAGNGTSLYRPNNESVEGYENVVGMTDALLADGYRLAELIWKPPGVWDGSGGSITLACRPATAIRWVYDNCYEGALYLAQGTSGGASQIAFSLAYYGVDDILDLANLASGPPPCPISTEGRLNVAVQAQCLVDGQLWGESTEPMLFGNPQLHYPNTTVSFFIGEQEPSDYIVMSATAYHDRISSAKSMLVVPNTGHAMNKTAEGAAALLASIREAESR